MDLLRLLAIFVPLSLKAIQLAVLPMGRDPNNDVGGLYETYGRAWVIKPKPEEVKQWHKVNQWNEMRVDAIGGNITVYVNDHKTAELTDDPGRREGYIALQLHGGATMDVEFKDVEILEYIPQPTSDSP